MRLVRGSINCSYSAVAIIISSLNDGKGHMRTFSGGKNFENGENVELVSKNIKEVAMISGSLKQSTSLRVLYFVFIRFSIPSAVLNSTFFPLEPDR